ncbi:AAA family ATPase [Kribbella sp. NPDC051770]|uniref:AAA family ATPase n=1 Tax=Kribbella sp. NPDC051770 TaxID=3155413 RepID=UPI003430770B
MRVLVTGMSGTGKSTVLRALQARGHRVVDTDSDEWCEWGVDEQGNEDWVWRVDVMEELLAQYADLFVAGCKSNQGLFYPRFERVVLLSAPAEVMVRRIDARSDNPYGKSPAERALVLEHLATVEPLLRASADLEIDTSGPLDAVVDELEALAY